MRRVHIPFLRVPRPEGHELIPPDQHAARGNPVHVVHLVHPVPWAARAVPEAGLIVAAVDPSPEGDPVLPVHDRGRHAADPVLLGVHHQLPEEMPGFDHPGRVEKQQVVRLALLRRLVQGVIQPLQIRHRQRRAQVRPGRLCLQILQRRPAGLLVAAEDHRLRPHIPGKIVPQPDLPVHGDGRHRHRRQILVRPAPRPKALVQVLPAQGGAQLPPAIKDVRHVGHPIRALRDPQIQLVVLAALVSFPQPSGLPQHLRPDHPEMADIVVRRQRLRLIIRLPVRIHVPPPVLRHHVLVGIQQIRMLPRDRLRHPPQRVRGQHVVMVAQGDVLPLRRRDGRVRIPGDAEILLRPDDPEPGLLRRGPPQRLRGFRKGAPPVVEDRLPVPIALIPQAFQQLPQIHGLRVVDRNHDADQPGCRGIIPLPLQLLPGGSFPPPLPVPGSEHDLARLFRAPADRVSRAVGLRVRLQSLQSVHFSRFLLIFFL